MKEYIINFFSYWGCSLTEQDQTLSVALTPELSQYFGKPHLHLVFDAEQITPETELVTPGSYLANRLFDLARANGEKVACKLPKQHVLHQEPELTPLRSCIQTRRSHEIQQTEVFLTFRIAYYSNEKIEELMTASIDTEGNLRKNVEFPYSAHTLHQAAIHHFPYTKTQAKELYDRCLNVVKEHAEHQAFSYQMKLAEHYHQDVLRLEGYYQQMIEEIPELTLHREESVLQLQHEYERKVSEELKRCHVQVTIDPVSFCAVTIPVRRYRYFLEPRNPAAHADGIAVEVYRNLFSGELHYPRCHSCHQEMTQVGICDISGHPTCADCLIECHLCGNHVCRECGIERCAECGQWVCEQCSERCHICGKSYCATHLLGCVECREHVCRQCSGQCQECGKVVGNIHLMECEISHASVCFECLVTCSCCDQHVSRSQSATCAFCGQQMCAECAFRCDICGQIFCVHHITECEISGKMVCPQHSGVCEQCGKLLSAPYLRTCDICGQKICVQCSVQCHECGVFFCEPHSKEMARCPECGHLYCSLCYSGQGVCHSCQQKT